MAIGTSDGEYFDNHFESLTKVYIDGKSKDDTDSTIPPGGSMEPAGALNPDGGTQQPVRPEPYGLNPPEGNSIQNYVKGIENDLRNLPETFRNIPEEFRKNMEKSKSKTDEERLDEAINITMSAGMGTIAGVKATTIKGKLADLGHAQILESNGVHPDEIWKTTGFGRGADGRWRHEIDDSKASFDRQWYPERDKFTTLLPQVLDHPELYKAYPQLKDVKVIHDPHFDGIAQWEGNAIRFGTKGAKDQGILMHEVQHAVQDIEGFSKGGSPRDDARYLKHTPDFEKLRPEMEAIVEKHQDPTAIWTTKDIERVKYLREVASKYKEYTEEAYKEAFKYYERLAGEVEARNVDTRLLMTEAERRKTSPTWTEDVSRSQQVPLDKPSSTTAYGINIGGKYIKPQAVVVEDAAIRVNGELFRGANHYEAYEKAVKKLGKEPVNYDDGFIVNGEFASREKTLSLTGIKDSAEDPNLHKRSSEYWKNKLKTK